MAAEQQDLNVPVIATVGIVASVLVAVIIIGTQAWYYNEFTREDEDKWKESPMPELAIKREAQKKMVIMGTPDTDTDTKDNIPIADAMQLSLEQNKSK